MILELTENEQITLLGILEDISQAENVNEVLPIQSRISIISLIQKLGGTYYGQMELNYRRKVKDILSSMYGVVGDQNGENI